jgi:pimeloyl-ACP methyl ester carboxylesterase
MRDLLLLHGAIGSSTQLRELQTHLQDQFTIHLFDFPGHGGKEMPQEFSIPFFAEAVLNFLKENRLSRINIFGYSMGGYVGMHLAKHRPEVVNRVATLATKFHWDEETATREVKLLQADVIEQKIPSFAEALKQRHTPNDWKLVLKKTADMLLAMGKQNPLQPGDYRSVHHRCLVLLGDKDKMVSRKETELVTDTLPNGELKFLEGTPHPIEQVSPAMLAGELEHFFKD